MGNRTDYFAPADFFIFLSAGVEASRGKAVIVDLVSAAHDKIALYIKNSPHILAVARGSVYAVALECALALYVSARLGCILELCECSKQLHGQTTACELWRAG